MRDYLNIRVTAADKVTLRDYCKSKGLGVSTLIRALLIREGII